MSKGGTLSKRSSIFFFAVCAMIIVPSDAFSAVLEIPPEAKTLSGIVLDVKAPLNRKLDELRKTYGIKEVKAGEFHFTDKKGQVVLTIVANRSLNAEGTQRVEEFLYTNRYGQLILHEKVITHGENLRFHDFEKRLYQTGVENYDLASDEETRKEGTIGMGAGTVFRVLTSRGEAGKVAIKRHQISVGELQQIEIRDTVDTENNYRTYEYSILEQQMMIRANGGFRGGWANWRGTLRITVRTVPGLLVPEVIYEKIGTSRATALNGSESFSRELYGKLIIPFIENGLVRLISQVVASRWVWPASESMQTIGTESKFLNELIVIRNEVNQAKTNPAVLSLVDVKLSVIIKDIQEGTLKISDFR